MPIVQNVVRDHEHYDNAEQHFAPKQKPSCNL